MPKIKNLSKALKPTDVGSWDIYGCEFDVRKDLHVYLDYIQSREIKRSVRENKIPKADARRIAKQLSDTKALKDIDEQGESDWLDFIEELALGLGFTRYDTQGEYLGYTSSSPSFVDNYIEFNEKAYQKFLSSSMQQQEQRIFDYLVGSYSVDNNEWFARSICGRLNPFYSWGCATGVVPGLKFDKARTFLFDCLAACQPGVWYDTASLIDFLKKKHPYFLIPLAPKFTYRSERRRGRYCNFEETKQDSYKRIDIPEKKRDAFERVEGRFVERFLENIPLTLGYVDLAYGTSIQPGIKPSLGSIKAFKINDYFLQFRSGLIPEPRVTVHPNHEIHVESPSYPAGMIARLDPFADLISTDKICIFKLNRLKAVHYMADDQATDVKTVLEGLSALALPANIATELDEWAGHSETFVLYEGCGLIEGKKLPAFTKDYELESLAADLRLVRSPDDLFAELEAAQHIPVLITHQAKALQAPPQGVKSVFTQKIKKARQTTQKELIKITQKNFITLFFQDKASLDVFAKALLEDRCIVEIDKQRKTVTYTAEQKKQVDSVMKTLKKTYRIKISKDQG